MSWHFVVLKQIKRILLYFHLIKVNNNNLLICSKKYVKYTAFDEKEIKKRQERIIIKNYPKSPATLELLKNVENMKLK